jgi:hypothetical protein
MTDASVACWTGPHTHVAAAALVAFAYYVPACGMIAPMFADAHAAGPDRASGRASFSRTYLSAQTLVKMAAMVLASFFFRDAHTRRLAAVLACDALLAGGTAAWLARAERRAVSGKPLRRAALCARVGGLGASSRARGPRAEAPRSAQQLRRRVATQGGRVCHGRVGRGLRAVGAAAVTAGGCTGGRGGSHRWRWRCRLLRAGAVWRRRQCA